MPFIFATIVGSTILITFLRSAIMDKMKGSYHYSTSLKTTFLVIVRPWWIMCSRPMIYLPMNSEYIWSMSSCCGQIRTKGSKSHCTVVVTNILTEVFCLVIISCQKRMKCLRIRCKGCKCDFPIVTAVHRFLGESQSLAKITGNVHLSNRISSNCRWVASTNEWCNPLHVF